LLVVLGVVAATPGVAQQTRQFAITEVNIVDVTNGRITPARTVVIVRILNDLAEVAKTATRDMAAAGVGILAGCDALIAGANPLTDVANVRRIRAVVLGGRLLDRTALDTLLAQTRAAAAQ